MSLAERIAAATECRVVGCQRHRVPDSLFCGDHLTEMWRNRLDRQPDGTYTPRRSFVARDFTGRLAA